MTDLRPYKAGAAAVDPDDYNTVIDNVTGGGGGGVTEITSNDLSVTITNPDGPTVDISVSGGAAFKDLGTVAAVDLVSGGPQTLYTPAAGEVVILMFPSGVTLDTGQISFGPMSDEPVSGGIYWIATGAVGSPLSQDSLFFAGSDVIPGAATYFPSGPIVARWGGFNYTDTGAPGSLLRGPVGSRQDSHAYTVGQGIIMADSIGANTVFVCSVAGTSAGSSPDFSAAGPSDIVTDGGVTWFDNGQRPTVGSVHVVALTGVPVAL